MKLRIFVTLSALAMLATAPCFAAEPTLQEIYHAAAIGQYHEAQTMMDQVLREHPRSAKAHYVEAELLAKQGKLPAARTELATAEQLQPGLPFATPGAVNELKDRIAGTGTVPLRRSASIATPAAIPWGLIATGVLLIAAIVFFMRRNRTSVISTPANGYAGYGNGQYAGPGTGPMGAGPMPGGAGSGILGSLATGAAVGAGVVAGEALMHRMLDGGRTERTEILPADNSWNDNASIYDMGGNDFGVADASSWDDSSGSDWS